MELLQLKYFCDSAQNENFSKTAKKYNVPASNISQSIKRLEKELGTPLFTRTANRISLNEQGKQFFTEIQKALSIIKNAKSKICKTDSATMKIGVFANRRVVMKTVEKFQKLYPDINIIISHEWEPKETDFDLIISDETKENKNLTREKFYEEKIFRLHTEIT